MSIADAFLVVLQQIASRNFGGLSKSNQLHAVFLLRRVQSQLFLH
jgi:hypothetical protein